MSSFAIRSLALLAIAALSAGLSLGLVLLVLDIHGSWRYPVGVIGSLAVLVTAAGLIWLVAKREVEEHHLGAVAWRIVVGLPLAFFGPFKPLWIPLFVVGIVLLGRASSIAMMLPHKHMKQWRFLAAAYVYSLVPTALFVLAADWIVLIRFLLSIKPESF